MRDRNRYAHFVIYVQSYRKATDEIIHPDSRRRLHHLLVIKESMEVVKYVLWNVHGFCRPVSEVESRGKLGRKGAIDSRGSTQ